MTEIENFVVRHKDFTTLMFTLVLILTSIVSALIAYSSIRELRKQRLFEVWVCLSNTLHGCQINLFEFTSRTALASGEQRVAIDEIVASLSSVIDMTQKRITQIENRLQLDIGADA